MTTTTSIRLSDTLVSDARRDAETFNRTISGQIEYWVRLGRAVESLPGFDLRRVRAALDGQFDAGMLSLDEKQIFEDRLGEAFVTPSAKSIAFMQALRNEGGAVGYDEAGHYVRILPGGSVEAIPEVGKP